MFTAREIAACVLGLSLAADTTFSQERDRNKIPEQYKWKLTDIYPSDEAWSADKDAMIRRLPDLSRWEGKLGTSPAELADCLDYLNDVAKQYAKLAVYAGMASDQDTREAKYLAMVQEMGQLGAEFGAKSSYVQPEILSIPRTTIDQFLKNEKRLTIYRHDLDDILRRKDHTGTSGEEKIIADAGLMADGPDNIYGIFSNADFPFPSAALSDGKTVKLDKAAFSLYRAVPNRDDRKLVFETYLGKLDEFKRTFGTQLYAEVKKDIFYMKARNYKSSLAAALDGNNIPVSVYRSLVDGVNANLPTFWRYLKLRQRMLGVDQLHYFDLYAPVVKSVDLNYTYEEAQNNVLAALSPLGTGYLTTAKKAFADRWFDVYPNTGKRAGAYSQGGAYDVHPYMLLNYNGKYDDMSTIAHELGHTMHSYYSNTSQPYNLSQYSIFVAEVASTFNEALLIDHMLKTTTDDNVRLSMLGSYLDNIRGTVFRQTQFAEFELRIHELAESGESLTGEVLDSLYLAITKKYYGDDKGVCVVDDMVKAEWANVPHFYYNFYVFQYATSFTASAALSEQVLAGDSSATHRYLDLLKAGASDYPIALLQHAGVDMTTPQPLQLTMKKMNRIMDEIEAILAKSNAK